MLNIRKVSKYYGDHLALKEVSLNIEKGTCFGLVGPNGAGKSTLLKIIANVILDYQGEVRLFDHKSKRYKEKIGYVPQEICLEQSLNAYDNLYFFGRLYGLKGKQLQERAEEVLKKIGLLEFARKKIGAYSGGMKRRLNIGCALMNNPSLVIMDEPTVGIDIESRKYIFSMIRKLAKSGTTIIYATHYMEEIEEVCHEVAFMKGGNIIESGKIDQLLNKYSIPSVYLQGPKKLPGFLKDLGQVKNYKKGYLITTDFPLPAMEKILSFYKKDSGKVDRLELVRPRLEDIFISLTGSALNEDRLTTDEERRVI